MSERSSGFVCTEGFTWAHHRSATFAIPYLPADKAHSIRVKETPPDNRRTPIGRRPTGVSGLVGLRNAPGLSPGSLEDEWVV